LTNSLASFPGVTPISTLHEKNCLHPFSSHFLITMQKLVIFDLNIFSKSF
jgi:hypothetical protein